jgi:hypothetical protein
MDFFFDLPTADGRYNGVLLVVDRFSKLVKLIPLTKDVSASKVAQLYLKYVYCNYGLPISIVSDQDTRFDSEFWLALWWLVSTSVHMGTARHPQTDRQSERTIKTIKQMLKMYLNKAGTNWLQWLPLAEFWYNSAKHSSTGKSPFEIVQGRNPRNPIDSAIGVDWSNDNAVATEIVKDMLSAKAVWLEVDPTMTWQKSTAGLVKGEKGVKAAIKDAQARFKRYYDKKHRSHSIKSGDWMRVRKVNFPQGYFHDDQKATLNSKYSAPARVVKVTNGSATLKANTDFAKDTRVHVSDLK